jgi:membrane peptidoglycan carboxypeptidase
MRAAARPTWDDEEATENRKAALIRPSHRRRRAWRWLRRLIVAVIVLAVLIGGGLIILLETTPSVTNAEALVQARLAAHHASSDNGVIPHKVGTALLATEDSRFYSDPALDPRGLIRGGWGELTGNSNAGGATIEVQLAKLLYTPEQNGLKATIKQVGIAIKFDDHYTKKQILAMYLNAAYFGDGAYGIVDAAHHYFGLPPGQLDWAQASLLAGLVQAPTDYDPHGHLTLALKRRAHVLSRLVATGTLTRARADQIAKQPLHPAVRFYG